MTQWVHSPNACPSHYDQRLARERLDMIAGTAAELVNAFLNDPVPLREDARQALGALTVFASEVKSTRE